MTLRKLALCAPLISQLISCILVTNKTKANSYLASSTNGVWGHFASILILTYFESLLAKVKVVDDDKKKNMIYLEENK